jgi:hypothetical protein
MFDFLLHWGYSKGMIYKNKEKDEILISDYKVRIIQNKFGDFLNNPSIW